MISPRPRPGNLYDLVDQAPTVGPACLSPTVIRQRITAAEHARRKNCPECAEWCPDWHSEPGNHPTCDCCDICLRVCRHARTIRRHHKALKLAERYAAQRPGAAR